MAQLKDLIVSGVTRCVGKLYAPDIVGNLTGTASRAIADNNGATIDSTYIKSVDSSDGVEVTVTYGNDDTYSFYVTGTEYSLASDTELGLVLLYSTTGDNTDGTMDQNSITNAINAVYASPAFTGTPTAPTVSDPSDSTTKIATTEFVQNAVQQAVEELVESGRYVASASSADGDALGTADLELLTFNVSASSDN